MTCRIGVYPHVVKIGHFSGTWLYAGHPHVNSHAHWSLKEILTLVLSAAIEKHECLSGTECGAECADRKRVIEGQPSVSVLSCRNAGARGRQVLLAW